jgi:hypothetical protein
MTTILGVSGVNMGGAPVAPATLPPADAQLVQRFDNAMGTTRVKLATDQEIQRLSAGDVDRLRSLHGLDDEAFRADAKILADIQHKIIVDGVLKGVRDVFESNPFE